MQRKFSNEYPTDKRIEEIWNAYKTGKTQAIADVLRRREAEENTPNRKYLLFCPMPTMSVPT